MRTALTLALVVLFALPALAEDEKPDNLAWQIETLLETRDRKAQADLVADLLDEEPEPDAVARLLAEGRRYDANVPTGWLERTNTCIDGVDRDYLLFVPEDYTPEKRYRLVLDMHGGVSQPRPLSHEGLERMKFFWGEHAQANGYLLAIPAGQVRAEWWSPIGSRNVLEVLRTIKREYNIDEDRVLATGFSDGASGSFYHALTQPTLFAGFIPLNGHLAVTQARGLQTHLLTLLNKPLYVVNTEKDSLYPSASVEPIVDALRPLGVKLVWRSLPDFTHNPMYLPRERPAIWKWMQDVVRIPHPKRVIWQGAGAAPRRVHWLNVTHLADVGNDTEFADPNPELAPGRVRLGVTVDQAFEGPGVRIETVAEDSPAADLKVESGDVIVGLDDADIADLRDLRGALGRKAYGDAFKLHLKRSDEILHLGGAFPEAKPRKVFRRTLPWSAAEATVKGNVIDVRVRRVGRFDLFLSDDLVDLSKPVVVKVNGETVHEGTVPPDLEFMLQQAARDEDRSLVYRAHLTIEVPRAPER